MLADSQLPEFGPCVKESRWPSLSSPCNSVLQRARCEVSAGTTPAPAGTSGLGRRFSIDHESLASDETPFGAAHLRAVGHYVTVSVLETAPDNAKGRDAVVSATPRGLRTGFA